MYEIKCEKCKEILMFDYNKTVSSCLKDLDYKKNTIKTIQGKWMATYLIYFCVNCEKEFKYIFSEVEKKVRETISEDVKKFRKVDMFKNKINPSTINPDNGLSFCGQCDGVDGEGNCFNDIIKQCTIKYEL